MKGCCAMGLYVEKGKGEEEVYSPTCDTRPWPKKPSIVYTLLEISMPRTGACAHREVRIKRL